MFLILLACLIYHWKVGKWSKCNPKHKDPLLDQSAGNCFRGYKTRPVNCVGQTGLLSNSACPSSTKPLRRMACFLKCETNCSISEWSEWLSCSCRATKALELRRRLVLVAPKYGGKECPQPLLEERSCASRCKKPEFQFGPWSYCYVVNGYYPDKTCTGTNSDNFLRRGLDKI